MQHKQFQVQVKAVGESFSLDRYPFPCTDDRDRDDEFRDRHDRDEEPNSKDEESDPVDPEVYLVDSVD